MKTKARLLASVKIWIVIYPALTLFLHLFREQLSVLPLYLRTLVLTATLVPIIVFLGVPTVDKVIALFTSKHAAEVK